MALSEEDGFTKLDIKIKEEPNPVTSSTMVKEEPGVTIKTSTEILSELFSVFNAEPPIITPVDSKTSIKSEKHGKHKKKHKHKDKKKKKKMLKSGRSSSDDSFSEEDTEYKHKNKKLKKSSKQSSSRHSRDFEEDNRSNENISMNNHRHSNCSTVKNSNELSVSNATKLTEGTLSDDLVMKSTVTNRITIKNLKFSSVFETNVRIAEEQARKKAEQYEEGELSDSNEKDYTENKSDKTNESKRRSKHRHGSISKHEKRSDYHSSRHKSRHHSKSRDCIRARSKDRKRSSSRDSKRKDKSSRSYYKSSEYDMPSRSSSYKYQDSKKSVGSYKNHYYSKSRTRSRSRSRSRNRTSHLDIDKKRLLAIARKNAIHMLKSGTLPGAAGLCKQAQEKVMAAIKSGGKSIEELTDFCKNLSQKEELGELSSVSSGESDHEEDGSDKLFHHPFVIKDRGAIVMNIKNSVQIPTKTLQEKTVEQVKSLRMQFPVSSGTHHRKTENEWVPVSPPRPAVTVSKPKKEVQSVLHTEIETPNVMSNIPETPYSLPANNASNTIDHVYSTPAPVAAPVFNTEQNTNLDISAIISQRLLAMRKLQENPSDINAMNDMYHAQKDMSVWAESKYEPGKFTGSTGANILSVRELQAGTQAWAKRDQLQKAAPVSGGMGMHLLQKMGWRPGEGLGKDKSGSLQPLMLEVKLDKKGLVANEEAPQKNNKQTTKKATVYTLEGKHPVSLLGEYASKRRLGAPSYELCFEGGPDHRKNFLFKVKLNGIEYQPGVASVNKKQAKADAATVCLQKLGVLPTT